MIVIPQFQCGVCAALYRTEKECMICETGHAIPQKIVSSQYLPIAHSLPYPITLEVAFSDGSVFEYSRTQCIKEKEETTASDGDNENNTDKKEEDPNQQTC